MTIDEIRMRLVGLQKEYADNPEVLKQVAENIGAIIDESMERNFSVTWNADKKCYER